MTNKSILQDFTRPELFLYHMKIVDAIFLHNMLLKIEANCELPS